MIASSLEPNTKPFRCMCGRRIATGDVVVLIENRVWGCLECAVLRRIKINHLLTARSYSPPLPPHAGSKIQVADPPEPPEEVDELGIPWSLRYGWFVPPAAAKRLAGQKQEPLDLEAVA